MASSIATKSGRAMIEALTGGEHRGPVLAQLARGKMCAKIPDLAMALEGRFGDHHALMCRLHLDHTGRGQAGDHGSRAMYKDGWWAAARLDKAPWDFSPETLKRVAPGVYDPDKDKWELYYLPDDFSQARDLAAEYPDKLRELQDLWWKEAGRNRVLPLLGGYSLLMGILPPMPTQTRLALPGCLRPAHRSGL